MEYDMDRYPKARAGTVEHTDYECQDTPEALTAWARDVVSQPSISATTNWKVQSDRGGRRSARLRRTETPTAVRAFGGGANRERIFADCVGGKTFDRDYPRRREQNGSFVSFGGLWGAVAALYRTRSYSPSRDLACRPRRRSALPRLGSWWCVRSAALRTATVLDSVIPALLR
jgi:hypothetical protein